MFLNNKTSTLDEVILAESMRKYQMYIVARSMKQRICVNEFTIGCEHSWPDERDISHMV